MSGIKTHVVQSNFANGVVSPRLKWTTSEEIHLSSAEEIRNATVGDYGEIERREGVVASAWGPLTKNSYGFTVQDSVTGEAERLVLTHKEDGTMRIYRSRELLRRTGAAPVLTNEDLENASEWWFPQTREVTEEREEDPEASKVKTATLTDFNTGTYAWSYRRKVKSEAFAGGYGEQVSDSSHLDEITAGCVLNVVAMTWGSSEANYRKAIEFYVNGSNKAPLASYTVTQEDADAGAKFKLVATVPDGAVVERTNFDTAQEADGTHYHFNGGLRWSFPAGEETPTSLFAPLKLKWVKVSGGAEEDATDWVMPLSDVTEAEPYVHFDVSERWETVEVSETFPAEKGNRLSAEGRLRHASHAGEEYFCGKGQPPFKVGLSDGVFRCEILDYDIPPFNDTVVGGEHKIYFKKFTGSDGTGFGIVQIPSAMRLSRFDALKLVNYDAKSSCKYAVSHKNYTTKLDKTDDGRYVSEMLPAFGNVTLKAEGSYWAGTVKLVERMKMRDGTTKDVDLGTLTAGGLASTMTMPASIENLNSKVFFEVVELTDAVSYMNSNAASPGSEYKDLGVTLSITVSGSQEVLCMPYNGIPPSEVTDAYPEEREGYETLVFRCDTELSADTFDTNTFATAIHRASLYDYPRTLCFFQDRLVFGGTDANPKKIFMSRTGDPLNFQLGVNDDDAVSTTVSGSDLEEIRWMSPREALIVGTSRREYSLRGSTSAAVTPTSIKASKPNGEGSYTSEDVECADTEGGVTCVRGGGNELLNYRYSSDTYTYVPTVMNPLCKELFEAEGGVADFAVLTRPETVVWVLFKSGRLMSARLTEDVKNGWTATDFSSVKVGENATARCEGIFVCRERERDVIGFVLRTTEGGEECEAAFFNSDAVRYSEEDAQTKREFAESGCAGEPYKDVLMLAGSAGCRSFAFETKIRTRPFRTSENDSWSKRVISVKSALCLCSARAFETSSDGGETWVQENRRFGADGKRAPLSYAEYELRSPGRWDDTAELQVRTSDDAPFVLSCVRTSLATGE